MDHRHESYRQEGSDLLERLEYRGTWGGTTEEDPRNFTYDILVSLWACDNVDDVCGQVQYPDLYPDIDPCAGTWTLQHERGTPASGELPGLGEPGERICHEIPTPGVPLAEGFNDCWAFYEDIPHGLCQNGPLGPNPVICSPKTHS